MRKNCAIGVLSILFFCIILVLVALLYRNDIKQYITDEIRAVFQNDILSIHSEIATVRHDLIITQNNLADSQYRIFINSREAYKAHLKIEMMTHNINQLTYGIENGFYIQSPIKNLIYQRETNGVDVPYKIVNLSKSLLIVSLYSSENVLLHNKSNSEGFFPNLAPGMYRMVISNGVKNVEFSFGVGDLYLVAGQSNAASLAQEHPPMSSVSQMVAVTHFYKKNNTGPFDIVIPTETDKIIGNISWLYCGDRLVKYYGIPIGFLNVAVGSTSTVKWNPKYDYLSNQISKVLTVTKVKAILWHQGESDVIEKESLSNYYSNLKALIEFSRIMQSDVKWVVALNSFKHDLGFDTSIVREAQQRLIGEGLALRGPDTDTIRVNPNWVDNSGAEFIGDGLKIHGELWFDVLSKMDS